MHSKVAGGKKTWKTVIDVIKECDVVLEVLDPRDPEAFRNKRIEKFAEEMGKKVIIVINKADLVPKEVLEKWKRYLSKEYPTVFISARERMGTKMLRREILKNAPQIPVRVAIVGYPNVGKSTIINILKGKHSAATGSMPGITKHSQAYKISRKLRIIDTPGVFPAEDEESLIYKGALRAESLDDPILPAISLIRKLKEKMKDVFLRTYSVDDEDPLELLKKLAIRLKRLKKGGEPDIDEAARKVIRDWQEGKIVIWTDPPDSSGE
ncbi:MAG: GTPase [Candidatus Baldrarchaeia archaeon]